MQDKDKTMDDDVRLAIEFQVTPLGAAGMTTTDTNNQYLRHIIHVGCQDQGKIVDGTKWDLRKASSKMDGGCEGLNRAIQHGWLVVSKINVDPTSTTKLVFRHVSVYGAGPMLSGGTEGETVWSLERYWTTRDKLLLLVNHWWTSNNIRITSIGSYCTSPTITTSAPVQAVSSTAKVDVIVSSSGIVDDKKHDKDNTDEEIRLSVEFRVQYYGMENVVFDNRNPAGSFFRAGCDSVSGRVVDGSTWKLDKALGSCGTGLYTVNQIIRNGWVVISRIFIDPASTMKLHFGCMLSSIGALECGRMGMGNWSLERFFASSQLSNEAVVKMVNDAWKHDKIQLSFIGDRRQHSDAEITPVDSTKNPINTSLPIAVVVPVVSPSKASVASVEAPLTTDAPVIGASDAMVSSARLAEREAAVKTREDSATVRERQFNDVIARVVKVAETFDKKQVTSIRTSTEPTVVPSPAVVVKEPVVTNTSPPIAVADTNQGLKKMQLIVSPIGMNLDRNPAMVRFLKHGCDGKSNVWTWDRYLQFATGTGGVSDFFKSAIANGYLQLANVTQSMRVSRKGIEHCEDNPIMHGPTQHFLLMGSIGDVASRIWMGLDQLRYRLQCQNDGMNSDASAMLRIAIANYDAYLTIAMDREWIVPV